MLVLVSEVFFFSAQEEAVPLPVQMHFARLQKGVSREATFMGSHSTSGPIRSGLSFYECNAEWWTTVNF